MNRYDLKGDCAIITGGAQGIGFAVAQRLIASGAHVCLWDIDQTLLEQAQTQLGSNCVIDQVDIANVDQVKSAAKSYHDVQGKISILVNCAGITGPNETVENYPSDAWNRVININLNATFYTNQAVIGYMKESNYGRIVNVASIAGKEGNPNASAYSASKAGVIGFTKSLGKEVADFDIAVNCVTPAAAKTRIFDQMTQEHIDYMLSKIPRGRFLELNEISSMITWLVSKENSFTTAGVFDVSGGRATY